MQVAAIVQQGIKLRSSIPFTDIAELLPTKYRISPN
jgi:hypothetical protein